MRRIPLVVPFSLLGAAAFAQNLKEFPEGMDFGPCIMSTFDGRGQSGFTLKGLVIRLGEQGAIAFDTELFRLSAAWTDGFLQLRGTAYDGAHGPMPALRGHKLCETKVGPGIAKDGSFDDPRSIPSGPLQKDWGIYHGYTMHGDRVVIGYSIGGMEVREAHAIETAGGEQFLAREFEFLPSSEERWLVIADADASAKAADSVLTKAQRAKAVAFAELQWVPAQQGLVEMSSSTKGWDRLSMGGPSSNDYLDKKNGTGATVSFVPGFARAHGSKVLGKDEQHSDATLALAALHDGGKAASAHDDQHSVWFDEQDGNDDGRFLVDLKKSVEVSRISSFTWGEGDRAVQRYDLFGSDSEIMPAANAVDPIKVGWQLVAKVDTGKLGQGDKQAASVAKDGGLGRFRHLLFVVSNGAAAFSEIDVFADKYRSAVDSSERSAMHLAVAVKGDEKCAELKTEGNRITMRVPPHKGMLRCKVLVGSGDSKQLAAMANLLEQSSGGEDLAELQKPAAGRWGAPITTKGTRGADDNAFAVDVVTIPFANRYGSRMRVCGFDFFADGRAAITTWNGDVWVVSGFDDSFANFAWQRFATGLFDPLGLKIVDDLIYVHGRDGITRLHDDNGDGEADRYECFNHDIYITNAFHEFAFDLQTDAAGNFYFSKAGPVNPGGRGFMKIVPHHGAILKLSKDGQHLETIASGLRAPNGIGVSPDGSIITSGDNEGTFMPRCRINWITKPGYYAGVKDTAHKTPVPEQPDLPLCWLPMEVDNSSGSQQWVTSNKWGPLQNRLLHLSYGTSSIYLVLNDGGKDQVQGGVVRLPVTLESSAMRARFHPQDGQLYVAGFQGWQTNAAKDGGFERIRYTGKPIQEPVALRTCDTGVYLTFLVPLDAVSAEDASSYSVELWNYLYSGNYGSPELSILHPERKVEQGKPNRDELKVVSAKLSPDGMTVFLKVAGMQPCNQMKVTWNLDGKGSAAMRGELHNSIHALDADPGFPTR